MPAILLLAWIPGATRWCELYAHGCVFSYFAEQDGRHLGPTIIVLDEFGKLDISARVQNTRVQNTGYNLQALPVLL